MFVTKTNKVRQVNGRLSHHIGLLTINKVEKQDINTQKSVIQTGNFNVLYKLLPHIILKASLVFGLKHHTHFKTHSLV